jgi:putative methionine-R-sulfoxide reductase with GAF domain
VSTQLERSVTIKKSKGFFAIKMITAVIIICIAMLIPLFAITSLLDAVFPSLIPDVAHQIKLFIQHIIINKNNMFNTKTFCLFLFLLISCGSGAFFIFKKWALWVTGREAEKFPLFTFAPNFLYSEHAALLYVNGNKDSIILKLENELIEIAKKNDARSLYVAELENLVTVSDREIRTVMNLDRLIAKCNRELFDDSVPTLVKLRYLLCSVASEIASTTDDFRQNKQSYIFLNENSTQRMVLLGDYRGGTHLEKNLTFSEGEGLVGYIMKTNEDICIPDLDKDNLGLIESNGERRYNSAIGVRIMYLDQLIGIVVVASQRKNEVSEADFNYIRRYINTILLILLASYSEKGGGSNEFIKNFQSATFS